MVRRQSRSKGPPKGQKLYINLPVKDIGRSREFFTKLGYRFDDQFPDENMAHLVIGEDSLVLLVAEGTFRTFTPKDVSDASVSTEVVMTLSAESREEVDGLVRRAVEAGARVPEGKMDAPTFYARGFEDPDGHLWSVVWADPGAGKKG